MCAASQRETCAGDGNVHLIMVTNVDSRLHGSMIRLATCCMNTVCDDLHREVARHQGNHLLQTQQWDPAGRLQEQLLGRSDDKTTLLKRTYTYTYTYTYT